MSKRVVVAPKSAPKAKTSNKKLAGKKAANRLKKTPRTHKPEGMSLEEWQIALRREFGREQAFKLENVGGESVFSEFAVTNPESRRTYRVAIRGTEPGVNFCSCPDYEINTLGTCKHIEFTLAKLERRRGGKAALAKGYRPPYSEVYLRHGAMRGIVLRLAETTSPRLRALAAKYFDGSGALKPAASAKFDMFMKEAVATGEEIRFYEDAITFVAQARDRERSRAAIDKAFPDGARSRVFDKLLKVPLHPYQREGAFFAARAGRALLADEMGLGKTIQAIAAAEILAKCAGIRRALVIAPTSLKHQWKQEIERFSGRSAEVIEGGRLARKTGFRSDTFFKITNYDVLHHDRDLILDWSPDLIVLDEAQRIKNWKTRAAQSVKTLASDYAIVLTGTPLENRIEELHSIVEFVDRHRLGPMFRFLSEHQQLEDKSKGRVVGYRKLERVNETLKPIMLRRRKAEVLDQLPERLDKNFFVPMTPEQKALHDENGEIVARIGSKWRKFGFLSDSDQRRLMIALQNMRMSCNSTYLLDPESDHGNKTNELMALLSEIMEQDDAKAVIFSQWVRTHELIERELGKSRWGHVLFHGGVPGPGRKALVDRFKNDPECRIFLSTDAGGVGLNLQHASVVVNMDQPWNPAVLEQRIGRVHRLGQSRPVQVINLIAQGTIGQGMLSLIAFKRSLFSGVLDGGQSEVFFGGSRLKKFMDSVEEATQSIPAAMPSEDMRGDASKRDAAEAKQETPSGFVDESILQSDGPRRNGKDAAREAAPSGPPGKPQINAAWGDLLSLGASLLGQLSESLRASESTPGARRSPGATGTPAALPASQWIERDEKTGQTFLRLPLPAEEILSNLGELLASLAGKR